MDTIGTMMIGMLLGPQYGALAGLLNGLIGFATGDPFSLYFCGSGIIAGVVAGFAFKGGKTSKPGIIWKTACISVPGSILTATISTLFFGGITSSVGSNIAVGIMRKLGFSLFASAFTMQLWQDYLDKLIGVILGLVILSRLPGSMKAIGRDDSIRKSN